MSLTYGLKTPRDLLAKLRRERQRLKADLSPDNFFNLVVTAYHIKDWIEKDPAVPASAASDMSAMYGNTDFVACQDLANASKHFVLDPAKTKKYPPIVAKTSAISAYGAGPYGKGAYGTGINTVIVVLNDGRRIDAIDLADNVIQAWEAFFAKHGI